MSQATQSFEEFSNECLEHLTALQDEFMTLYNVNSYEHWYYDHGISAFHFKSDDGRNLYFKYVDVGSFSTNKNTWIWSWDNKTTTKHVAKGRERVKAYGEKKDFSDLSQGLLENGDEYMGWALTVITAKLLNAIGAYRGMSRIAFVYSATKSIFVTNVLLRQVFCHKLR